MSQKSANDIINAHDKFILTVLSVTLSALVFKMYVDIRSLKKEVDELKSHRNSISQDIDELYLRSEK